MCPINDCFVTTISSNLYLLIFCCVRAEEHDSVHISFHTLYIILIVVVIAWKGAIFIRFE